MRLPDYYIKDALFLFGLLLMVALSYLAGLVFYDVPCAIAVSLDVAAILVCVGKSLGKRLGLRYSFWQSPLTLGEWIVLAFALLYVNLTAFSPTIISIGVQRGVLVQGLLITEWNEPSSGPSSGPSSRVPEFLSWSSES